MVTASPTGAPEDKGSKSSKNGPLGFLVDIFGEKIAGIPTEQAGYTAIIIAIVYYVYKNGQENARS